MSGRSGDGTWQTLEKLMHDVPVVDAHTHVQDDIARFDRTMAETNLGGTQSAVNRPSPEVLAESIRRGTHVRRTMLDATHVLFYPWFAAIAEGAGGRVEEAIALCGDNTDRERRRAGAFLLAQYRDSRCSEYAAWMRFMLRLYTGSSGAGDPLDPDGFDAVCDAVAARRHDPGFAGAVLRANGVRAYVTSIENRDNVPLRPPVRPGDVDLSYAHHPEAWSMFDCHPLIWPERATDAGLFLQGHRFEAERYIPHLEEYFGRTIATTAQLQDAVQEFFRTIIRSPRTNPGSRVLYVNCYQAADWRFSAPWSRATVDDALRNHRDQLDGERRRQVIACVAEAMLIALDGIGREYREAGERFGCCLQMCSGAAHFMDWARMIHSIPEPIPRLALEEYPVWSRFPDVQFEYLCAHEGLAIELALAAKQVPNVSVGPWWHLFRRRAVARLLREQIGMGPLGAIALGFTDARFVEMIAAKYRSLRLAVVDALADLVDDESSCLHRDVDGAAKVMRELLLVNPAAVHHIPLAGEGPP